MHPITFQETSHCCLNSLSEELRAKLKRDLPARAYNALLCAPKTHDSQALLFSMAGNLHKAGFEEWERIRVLESWFSGYYRPIAPREIERAATRATGNVVGNAPKWPKPDSSLIAKVIGHSPGGLDELKSRSEPNPETLSTDCIIDRLFQPTDLICMATSLAQAVTAKREDFRGKAHNYQFIVPNPMASPKGLTSDGKVSPRCLTNVGPTTYQVIEFDQGSLEEQARIHLHLASMVPLRLAVFSGRRSIHAWFDVRDLGGRAVNLFRRYARALGADRATFTPCQLVRTPNALRDNGAQQTVYYISSNDSK